LAVITSHTSDRLSRWERAALVLILVLFVAFGVLVEYRSAFLRRRMGDLGCYLRAAWAVRTGNDLYDVTDDNGWHYNYPPLYAILMAPLGDPPRGADAAGFVPYAVSVAVVYALNLVFLALAVHWLAGALEYASLGPSGRWLAWDSRRWWRLRVLPLLVCLAPIGHTLMRGQANLLLLALVCGMIAAAVRGRRFLAGVSLAGAICLKIFPAFLLLYPLWRRDGRCLAGCAAGLAVGLGVVPVIALGPQRAVDSYRELAVVLVGPALGWGDDRSRADELIEVTATDSQSFLAAIHNTLHLDRESRPKTASSEVRRAHWLLGGTFTLLTLCAARWRRQESAWETTLFIGALTLVMILCSPVCHTHYFTLSLPLVMGLLALAWQRHGSMIIGAGLKVLLAVQVVGNVLPLLPPLEVLKDIGLAMYTALALWAAACVALWKQGQPPAAGAEGRCDLAAAA
jgi:hypothetical protein